MFCSNNAVVVHSILELGIASSVKELSNFFSMIFYQINGHLFSPDDMEHGILRANSRPPFRPFALFGRNDPRRPFILKKMDPRIHFALVCGSRSCAPIRFYDADRMDEQLDLAARSFVNSSEVLLLPEQNKIFLSQIFDWYKGDFGGNRGVFHFLLDYLDEDETARFIMENMETIKVEYLFYDWNLNH